MSSTTASGIGRVEPAVSIDKSINDEAQLNLIIDAARAVLILDDRLFAALLERNYAHLVLLSDYYTNIFAHGERPVSITRRSAAFWWGAELLNWLNAMYAFLEHYEKQIAREFGKESDESERFNKARNQAHADSDSYKFIYELRHYATHRGFPVTHIDAKLATDGAARGIEQETEFLLDKKQLLDTYSEWGWAKAVLESFQSRFSPLPHVENMMTCLRQLFAVVFKLRAERAWAKLGVLEKAIEGIDTSASWPYVLEIATREDGDTIEISRLAINIENIKKLRALGPSPEYSDFYPELHQDPGPPTWISATAENKRLTRLGAALISERYEGPGDDQSFSEAVHRFVVAEGNDVGPIITGLTNTAMTAVQLAATAIGRNPQSTLALMAEVERIDPD